MNNIFRFKQFDLDQSDCGMKISTDGIVFGSWVNATGCAKILDVGAGSGLLSLMLAQRFPEAHIDAIEIEPTAAERARENFSNSLWSERLKLIEGDFKDFEPSGKYDLVVSNPPYYSTTHQYSSSRRKLARNTHALSLKNLVEGAKKVSPEGMFSVIIPARFENELKGLCSENGYGEVIETTELIPIHGKPSSRVMMTFTRSDSVRSERRNSLTVYNENSAYTEQFLKQTEAFYL
ncbi:tRNA1(Val) (adenine(37)-N6)-methyltransferase [Halocola ammonii]